MAEVKRASLNAREAALCQEALWQLEASDRRFDTDEVRQLLAKLDRYAEIPDTQQATDE